MLAETAVLPETGRRMTIEEFWKLPEGPPYYEFEDGEVTEMARPHGQHQRALRVLLRAVDGYLDEHGGGEVWPEIDVELSPRRAYAPDLVFLTEEHADRYSDDTGRVHGAPDLVVEIASPGTVGRDRLTKLTNYAREGVSWYWLVDPQALVVEELRLSGEAYLHVGGADMGETFEPQLFPGLQLNLRELLARRRTGAEAEIEE
ncbi:MAG: Uma2 family endonuclease [Armatimonadetes bacterium CG_4_10_14_3_um_filter_66_18]|nr:Uma2 family endonuclease [Armatimonadota bacterium]OIP04703.1 MAG: hypothetical protein AUJ96_12110 [Armatimonadetes bacterium CG2_30_66_41]PIU93241.1 MAG: Uma2 family endonuclease [Armatimonadetes bacterium CG06_land_8_20_14_3_00_66_21]PIX48630.1 MAG: Uma2 family endonuclease [Armatimonadetes bacterium CG_4_8_14_3_um_filter_66_20]PIY42870.1 MAG: Uma2 family endonuclease [Armatimonadetes bacterium CG_4_10_14_3_um_filter_66_18]PIZ33827.1 MAG: Uma2 family endonuclease [Armatimonadetes bacteri